MCGASTAELDYAFKEWIVLDKLVGVVLSNVKGCVVEIGAGYSTLVLAKQAEDVGVKLYSCDISTRKCDWVRKAIAYDGLVVFRGSSKAFLDQFDDVPAVVFIDGNHHYSTIKFESDFLLEKMPYGGVMFLHDTMPWQRTYEKKVGSNKEITTHILRKEFEKREDLECFTWPYTAVQCGLTMLLKKDMSQPFYRT